MALRRQTAVAALLAALSVAACSESSGPELPIVGSIGVAGLPDTLGVGDTLDLTAEARDTAGTALSGVVLRWRSLTPAVATVDSTGRLAARDSGEATLVVVARGRRTVEDTISVPVRRLPRRIEIAGLPTDSLFGRTSDTVTAVVRDGLGAVLALPVRWSSSDAGTVIVDTTKGVVFARESGDAWLRVTSRGFTDSVRVRVRDRRIATPVPFVDFASISFAAGTDIPELRNCGLAASGSVWCSMDPRTQPFTQLPGGVLFRDVQASQSTVCGLATDDRLWCWGRNQYGNFGQGSLTPATSATPVLAADGRRFSSIALGAHSLVCGVGVTDSLAYCWGHNDAAQTGRYPTSGTEVTVAVVPGLPKVKQVSAGFVQACAIAVDDSTWCWGSGFTTSATPSPRAVAAPGVFTQVMAGNGRHCGLASTGMVSCFWSTDAPQPVVGAPAIASLVSASAETGSCGLTAAGAAYCFIDSSTGDASPAFRGRAVKELAFGMLGLQCAVTTAGELFC